MCFAVEQQREQLAMRARAFLPRCSDEPLKNALTAWLDGFNRTEGTRERADEAIAALARVAPGSSDEDCRYLWQNREHFVKKSMWMYGGDGWAYDIGYGGLDHVLALELKLLLKSMCEATERKHTMTVQPFTYIRYSFSPFFI